MSDLYDVIIVGAGPSGLACAIEARRRGLDFLVLEKGCIVNSIYHYPENMTFFTTAELLEIGEIPMIVREAKPNRPDALKYYRRVADHYRLPIRDFEKVNSIHRENHHFVVHTHDRFNDLHQYRTRTVIIATGYFDNPNFLKIPGEDLPKVSHYYGDPHPYFHKKVAVIGGKNSAAIAALELFRNGAEVTLIHRAESLGREIKYWILPDIQNRIKKGEIATFFSSRVKAIRNREIEVETPEGVRVLENDYVFALTGYHPDVDFLKQIGIRVDPESCIPSHDPETLETNINGVYLAGSIVSGKLTNRIFIENGRFHPQQIFPHLVESLKPVAAGKI